MWLQLKFNHYNWDGVHPYHDSTWLNKCNMGVKIYPTQWFCFLTSASKSEGCYGSNSEVIYILFFNLGSMWKWRIHDVGRRQLLTIGQTELMLQDFSSATNTSYIKTRKKWIHSLLNIYTFSLIPAMCLTLFCTLKESKEIPRC